MPADDHDADDLVAPRGEFDENNPFRAIVATILELVPVSHWTLTVPGDDRTGSGPGIGPILGPLGRYSTGLALVFADNRAQYGMLTLLRADDLGPFTSSEIRTLTFALDAASDRLSEIRLMEAEDAGLTAFRLEQVAAGDPAGDAADSDVAQYVLNADLEIVLAWTSESERRVAVTPFRTNLQNRLPAVLEESVRQLTTA